MCLLRSTDWIFKYNSPYLILRVYKPNSNIRQPTPEAAKPLLSNWSLQLGVGAADSDVIRCGQLLCLNLDARRRDDFEIQDEETEFASRLYSWVGRRYGKMPENITALFVTQSCVTTILLFARQTKRASILLNMFLSVLNNAFGC